MNPAEPYLPRRTVALEQSRRRVLLISIAALMLLSISPVLGHHLARGADAMLSGTDRIGELCLVALHVLLAPIHEAFHVALVLGLAYAIWDRVRAWRSATSVLAQLGPKLPVPGDAFWMASRAVGIDPTILRIVRGLPNPAFTIGWMRPRVYVAGELSRELGENELRAVLAHEGAHVARRDPLRLGMLRFLACVIFWVPALRRLAADMADESEVQADDVAARHDPLAVASALLTIASWGRDSRTPATALAFTNDALLERRVRRLAGEEAVVGTHVTRRSIVGASAMLILVWLSGAIMAHPLPAMSSHVTASASEHRRSALDADAENCRRHRGSALAHLLCKKVLLADGRAHCPHELTHAHV
jgi:Zn-dependent protease with chaperone function